MANGYLNTANPGFQGNYVTLSEQPAVTSGVPPEIGPLEELEGTPRPDTSHCDIIDQYCRPVFMLEKHMTVIRKGPTMPPTLEMYSYEEGVEDINTLSEGAITAAEFTGAHMFNHTNFCAAPPCSPPWGNDGTANDGSDISMFYTPGKQIKVAGDEIHIPIDILDPVTGGQDWADGDQLIIKYEYENSFGQKIKCTARVQIIVAINAPTPLLGGGSGMWGYDWMTNSYANHVLARIMSIDGTFPILANKASDLYEVFLVQKPPIFEKKFPKFSYRYKYKDGEYSVFGPWSEIAFIPSDFDYAPKKGYNLGMVNSLRTLKVLNWRPSNMPKDVIAIDLLYKESNSPNIYTVATFKEDDSIEGSMPTNYWNTKGTGDHYGRYTIKSELIHKVVPSNQLLRPWDNVPRVAKAQEITANRLIYANYLQQYNLIDVNDNEVPDVHFLPNIETYDYSLSPGSLDPAKVGLPSKSLKSMRTYQLGVVYRDRYGRETPVLTSKSGSITLPKLNAKLQNRLSVELTNEPPQWAESYTFYIKETSNEYYNLAMDRWYDAEDGGVWLSFPSVERNKISDRTVLILKKQHDTHIFTDFETKYKVLSISNDAPTFIKTDNKYWGSLPMMLPPPGWGHLGTWDTGMFYNTGLPLPNRMFIDIYADYWQQSHLAELINEPRAEIRIIQSIGQASAYAATTSDTTNKTEWYDVANISYIGSPASTYEEAVTDPTTGNVITTEFEESGQQEQLVRITLKKAFGQDAIFCEPLDNLSLSRGLSIEARTKQVKDRAQFEGRFFVKVLRDANIDQNIIQPQQQIDDKYQVLLSKRLRYVCAGHPGLQDWNKDPNYYIEVATSFGVGSTSDGGLVSPIQTNNLLEVSSYPAGHRWATYNDKNDSISSYPTSTPATNPLWPRGPGPSTKYVYHSNWQGIGEWYQLYKNVTVKDFDSTVMAINGGTMWTSMQEYLPNYRCNNCVTAGAVKTEFTNPFVADPGGSNTPAYSWGARSWPAFVPAQWNPRMTNEFGAAMDAATGLGYYGDIFGMVAPFPLNNCGSQGILDLTDLSTTSGWGPQTAPAHLNWLDGANPFALPAIWGDQNTDFLSLPAGGKPRFKKNTIQNLRRSWLDLWTGKDEISTNWPLGRFSPERWIIDKAGSADGYSGAGIWDDGSVSYMDIAFWGIGADSWGAGLNRKQWKDDPISCINDMHLGEMSFINLLVVGTQFRFREDPDGIIYTIRQVQMDSVHNYEAAQGVYGIDDGFGLKVGGSGMARDIVHPWGNGWASKIDDGHMYLSDVFHSSMPDKRETGGAPQNRRVRWTLTLDKIVGSEGTYNFHPITNHVDENGNANIYDGQQAYHTGLSGIHGNLLASDGATSPGLQFYNLSSYWNRTAGIPTSSQAPSNASQDAGQYIGLHERGLNATTIEIVTPYKGEVRDNNMSDNPAIWETEPMEDVGLDLYYAASPTYPVNLKRFRDDHLEQGAIDPLDPFGANWYDYMFRGEEVIPVGAIAKVLTISDIVNTATVCNIQGDLIWFDYDSTYESAFYDAGGMPIELGAGDIIRFIWQGEGTYYGTGSDEEWIEMTVLEAHSKYIYRFQGDTHKYRRSLGYYNCWSYGSGVESNRVRDDYNAVTIDKGVKASMPLAEQYKEERKGSGLIFSGIYNSTSGVNRTNQFIQAEPITKDLNPVNGSIQKLFTRDTDLLTFCENKVFKILAKKDALFNADGNTNVTSNAQVLGQSIPFTGEYGISKNPESFASESYRVYFSDKDRGAILRLSRDGITPISSQGMKDWFRDHLRFSNSIIGSYDDRLDQYNVSLETNNEHETKLEAFTLSYTEARKGWVSFKSFIQQGGISHKNKYYTFPNDEFHRYGSQDPWEVTYQIPSLGLSEVWMHDLDLDLKKIISVSASGVNTITIFHSGNLTPFNGMIIEGNGIPVDTVIVGVNCGGGQCNLTTDNVIQQVSANQEVRLISPRNDFYGNSNHYSMVRVLFNGAKGSVKRFKTLDYEGTQTRTTFDVNNFYELHDNNSTVSTGQIYYDNWPKKGWYSHHIFTDMQDGRVPEFIDKENKWFNYISGHEVQSGYQDTLNTGEFSLQGLGWSDESVQEEPWDCVEGTCVQHPSGPYESEFKCLQDCTPIEPPTWDCVGLDCVEKLDGSGFYLSLASCQLDCGPEDPESYFCINGECIDPGDGTGTYSSLDDCELNCWVPSWNCTNTGCVDPKDGTGLYQFLSVCESACVKDSWNCVNGNCVDPGDGSGTYLVYQDCWDNCLPVSGESWDCDGMGNCFDPGNGNGPYPDLLACQADCIPGPEETYNCDVDLGCVDPGDGSGTYTGVGALNNCMDQCGEPTWNCDGVNCVDPGNGTGQYDTLIACQQACTDIHTWDCIDGGCVEHPAGQGFYATLSDCQGACDDTEGRWECDGMGTCYDPGNGTGPWDTKSACDQFCGGINPILTYDCKSGACVPNPFGAGFYADLLSCTNDCK